MRHFVIILKANILLYVVTSIESRIIEGNLPNVSVISNLINEFVKPYLHSLDLARNGPGYRASKKRIVENTIRQKIIELKPFLQDDDHKIIASEENITLDDSEETTIIEFTQDSKNIKGVGRNRKETKPDVFKADIKIYKKLREKITRALQKEPVSDKTIKLVTSAFDGLIAKLIGSQCMWKSADHGEKTFRFGKTDEDTLLKMHNITREDWENFKHKYVKLTQKKFVNETLAMFNKLNGFFSRIINNTKSLSKYRINCQLVKLKQRIKEGEKYIKPDVLRDNNDLDECGDFQICSYELTIFIIHFSNALNDTAVSAFRNYAAMYSRDVTTDQSFEKDTVINLINNISNIVERKVYKIFAKDTKNFKLDKNKNKGHNIKILIQYINSTTEHVKRHIKKHLERYLKSLKLRLLLNVKRDIDVNLSVDLGNLARDFISRICTVFITCNGRYLSRRSKNVLHPWGNLHVKDGKSVYVKVQLTFDDALKNTLVRNKQKIADTLSNIKDTRRDIKEKYKHLNVTRTTRKDSSSTLSTNFNFNSGLPKKSTNNGDNKT